MTDHKQEPERIWAVKFVEPRHVLDSAGKYWNRRVNCGKEYIRKDLHDALAKQRDELYAEMQAWKLRCVKAEAERDQALAASAAREIAMRDRAALVCETLALELRESENGYHQPQSDAMFERAGAIRALPIPPDRQQALNEMLADAWVDGMWAGLGEDGPVFDKNPHRKE